MSAITLLCILIFAQSQIVRAVEPTYEELQAAYIQKFINYIEWPASSNSQFMIAVYQNENEFEAMKGALEGKKIQDRSAVVVHLTKFDHTQNYEIVHVKTFDHSTAKELHKLLNKPTLVIAQDLEALTKEVVINFFLENGKLRFDINIERANEINLKINSRLLKLARKLK